MEIFDNKSILDRKEDSKFASPNCGKLESLLEKYNGAIIDATTGYYVDLNKVWITISKPPFADWHLYLFARDWPLQWIQQIYTAL